MLSRPFLCFLPRTALLSPARISFSSRPIQCPQRRAYSDPTGETWWKDKEKDNEDSAELKNEEKDPEKSKGDVTVDEACWIYKQLKCPDQDIYKCRRASRQKRHAFIGLTTGDRSRRARILTNHQAAHNHAATGMWPLNIARDESRRMAVPLRSSWN